MGCECAAFGATRLKVVLPPGVEIRDVYHLAAHQDVRIRRLNYRRDSLEDLFLNAVEHAGASNGRL
jgi:ABC-2 type transport system ATP-binding protein